MTLGMVQTVFARSDAVAHESPTGQIFGRDATWWLVVAIGLGLYLSLRGYHSFDGDQTYRLPLLLHWQNPSLYADDPFVRAFDAFNPHRGWLVVLDAVTRPLGMAFGLFALFVVMFITTCRGAYRLGQSVWPEHTGTVGWIAVGLILAAKAGNIGTNHLFEAMVLDRLVAFALAWLAVAAAVSRANTVCWLSIVAVGLATWVHPSAGLQIAMVLGASWVVWALLGRWTRVRRRPAVVNLAGLALALWPGVAMNLSNGASLLGELRPTDFWLLSVELQGPQHMLPHLWRMPQWLAWSCYLVLVALQLARGGLVWPHARSWPLARLRLVVSLAIILVGLGLAWYSIEVLHQVRVTVFQPFRMATVARGMALALVAGRIAELWKCGESIGRLRAILLIVGFIGDWLLVVATLAEVVVSLIGPAAGLLPPKGARQFAEWLALAGMLALGLNFLAHHDTESGHLPLLLAIGTGLAVGYLVPRVSVKLAARTGKRAGPARYWPEVLVGAWALPLAALAVSAIPWDRPESRHALVQALINRCRFVAVPADDIERLALWCRSHTPETERFIGPPGPKTFRLWSRRSLAFNRAASPYDGAGLADWFRRFQDHVDDHGPPAEFVRAYVAGRHRFEARYQSQSDAQRAALALRQGASYVIAAPPADRAGDLCQDGPHARRPLELLHTEGRYAVYLVTPPEKLVQRHR
jgi:hypothetical protein